jgi:hypothetical protein
LGWGEGAGLLGRGGLEARPTGSPGQAGWKPAPPGFAPPRFAPPRARPTWIYLPAMGVGRVRMPDLALASMAALAALI